MDQINNLLSESRGQTEAISHAMLFLMVIGFVVVAVPSGLGIVDAVQTSEITDQNIDNFEELRDNTNRLSTDFGYDFNSTATITQQMNTFDGELRRGNDTVITVREDSGSEIAEFTSNTIVVTGGTSDVVYDTQIVGIKKRTESNTISTPKREANIVPLITTNTTSELKYGKYNDRQLLISREKADNYSPETLQDTSNVRIDINTDNKEMWKTNLENQGFKISDDNLNDIEVPDDVILLHYEVKIESE